MKSNHTYTPIFIIVHDQLYHLKRSVQSYETLIKSPIKIIFHDVKSTYKPTLDYLEEMKSKGYEVFRSEVNHHHTVKNTINTYLNDHPECKYYVLTDPDIELDEINGDIIDFYMHCLEELKCSSVGPMLRIDDIPDHYPKKNIAISRHRSQFWDKQPKIIPFKSNEYKYISCSTDTTFQFCKSTFRPSSYPYGGAVRTFSPYSCRHLDWYIDPKNLTDCQKYYIENTTNISHWAHKTWGKSLMS
jgi:hypothetical protein